MPELEKRVYSGWAFSDGESKKAKINREIYEEIKDKADVKLVSTGYAHKKYKVINNRPVLPFPSKKG
jgi:hypothetical protein